MKFCPKFLKMLYLDYCFLMFLSYKIKAIYWELSFFDALVVLPLDLLKRSSKKAWHLSAVWKLQKTFVKTVEKKQHKLFDKAFFETTWAYCEKHLEMDKSCIRKTCYQSKTFKPWLNLEILQALSTKVINTYMIFFTLSTF